MNVELFKVLRLVTIAEATHFAPSLSAEDKQLVVRHAPVSFTVLHLHEGTGKLRKTSAGNHQIPEKRTPVQRFTAPASTRMKPAMFDLKEELLKWICERHATNRPLDRQLLRKKALGLATSSGVTGFKCSEAWLTMFLKKYGFSPSLTNCGGPTFPDYRVWVDLLRSLITQYRHKDLFNVDELVMYSHFVPARTCSETSDHQQHSDQVTNPHEAFFPPALTNHVGMLMCCNSSGTEKLPALISGPYQLDNSRNDCHYYRDEGSCIPDDVFTDWLLRLNQDMAKSDRRILLLLNRDRICASQKSSQLSHVNLLYFPKNFPTQLRPLRGDVFHCVKMMYRSRYVQHIRSSDVNKQWGADEIVASIVQAWDAVTQELIVASFQRTKFREDESFLKIECPAWEDLGTGISFKRFVTFDDELSDSSINLPEDLEFLARGSRHQYNLRNSCKGTVDLDDFRTILDDSKRSKKTRCETIIGSTQQETSNQEVQSDDKTQESSRLTTRRKNVGKSADFEEEQRDSDNSQITDEDTSSNERSRRQRLVDRIQDFLEDDIPPKVTIMNDVGETSSSRNHCDFINVPYEQSERMRVLSFRIVSDSDYEGKFPGEDTDGEDYLRRDSMEQIDSILNPDERRSQSMKQDELVQNLPGEFGPSGKGLYVRAETFGYKNPSPRVKEFNDKEETPNGQQLELKIHDAIKCCDDVERSDDAGNLGHPSNDNPRTSKRTGEHFDPDEPAEKRARTDGSWSKHYETNFVFGPELHGSANIQSIEFSTADVQEARNQEPITKSKKTQTRGSELDKRCLFTIEGSLPGVSYPATED